MKFYYGGLRFALFITEDDGKVFNFTDKQEAKILTLPCVEEFGSEGYQDFKVVIHIEAQEDHGLCLLDAIDEAKKVEVFIKEEIRKIMSD